MIKVISFYPLSSFFFISFLFPAHIRKSNKKFHLVFYSNKSENHIKKISVNEKEQKKKRRGFHLASIGLGVGRFSDITGPGFYYLVGSYWHRSIRVFKSHSPRFIFPVIESFDSIETSHILSFRQFFPFLFLFFIRASNLQHHGKIRG